MLRRVNHNQVRSELRSKGVGGKYKKNTRTHTHTHTHTHTFFRVSCFYFNFRGGNGMSPVVFPRITPTPGSRLTKCLLLAVGIGWPLDVSCQHCWLLATKLNSHQLSAVSSG